MRTNVSQAGKRSCECSGLSAIGRGMGRSAGVAVRGAAAALPMLLAVGLFGWFSATGLYADPPPAETVEEVQGAPKRWEAVMPVGHYSAVNMRTGRVLTTLPVVGWGGLGPATSFSLFHNMNSAFPPHLKLLSDDDPIDDITPMGDANGDGRLTESDITPFVDVVMDDTPTAAQITSWISKRKGGDAYGCDALFQMTWKGM